jgi:hypothetical protein
MIWSGERHPRLVAVRCGGRLDDSAHRALAEWAAECAEHVLALCEAADPADDRPRRAVAAARAWAGGELAMMRARAAGGEANGAARDLTGAPRYAAYAAAQAACVGHVAEHGLGAAAYAIRAVQTAAPATEREAAGRAECRWQRGRLPDSIRGLVIWDQARRNHLCWGVFEV